MVFQATLDGARREVMGGEVRPDGTLSAALPTRPNGAALLARPSTLMPDLRERRCQPTGPLPATDARLLIVDGAALLDASGARRGVVVPATAVIGSAAQAQSAVGMSRVYVCSDRAVTFRSALNCAYTRMTDGETRVGTTSADIDIRLKRGWNVLTARTVRPDYTSSADSPMTVLLGPRGLTWRYLPER